ncbi:Mre11 DNA-binding presumed domain-containing protein, partial [Blyttiomyces helicus]
MVDSQLPLGSPAPQDPKPPADPDTFTILIATDNHIGYLEKDPVRKDDSFKAFEEILTIARERDVDFILLGGDLFHENKPSRKCLYQTMAMLRAHCLGDRPCRMEFMSDQSENFPDRFATVNYQDPNFNVGMPIFSIHGNHDDPSGDGALCSLDILSVAGLINYFGRQSEVDDISIKPILLRKGTSRLALYGLGNVRDERLNRTFQKKRVKMFRPREGAEEWFNLLIFSTCPEKGQYPEAKAVTLSLRTAHGPTNYVPENFLDDFLQLVLWGHEHECRIDPAENSAQGFYVTQPGSSVATSLCEGEAVEKHVGILEIKGTDFQLEKIRLKTVRPFIMDEVVLKDETDLRPTDTAMVDAFLKDKVQSLIDTALREWRELNPDVPEEAEPKPLIRLKVEYSGGFTTFNPQRFGQAFVAAVANPKDILHFYRRRVPQKPSEKKQAIDTGNIDAFIPEKLENFRVEDLVTEYLSTQNLDILPENELGNAVREFVEKDENDAIKEFVEKSLFQTREVLASRQLPTEEKDDEAIREEVLNEKRKLAEKFARLPAENVAEKRRRAKTA